jgi:hypothetical protein
MTIQVVAPLVVWLVFVYWPADVSTKGLRESYRLMVNDRYYLRYIEANHEAFVKEGAIIGSDPVHRDLLTLAACRT